MASVADDVDTAEVSNRREDGVRTIQESDLTCVVWLLALGDEHVETGLVGRELLTQLGDRHVGWLLDDPEVEDLGLYHQVVAIASTLLELVDVLAWEARNDAVNEGCADVVVLEEPVLELLVVLAEVLFPELDVLLDALLEVVTVEEDELTRHEDEALLGVTVECLETTIEQLSQLTWIRRSRSVGELAVRIESNSSLGGVRDHETDVWLLSQGHESCVL